MNDPLGAEPIEFYNWCMANREKYHPGDDGVLNRRDYEVWKAAYTAGRESMREATAVSNASHAAQRVEREACKQAVRDEPELEDEMPREMLEYMTRGQAEMTEALRAVVRATKLEILARIDLRSEAV